MSRHRMKRCLLVLSSLVVGLSGMEAGAGFSYQWDFSGGLAGWTALGDVAEVNQAARIGDGQADHGILYRAAAWDQPTLTIEVDIRGLLSESVPPGTFADAFFGSLYFVDDIGTFDLASQTFDHALPLFTFDTAQGMRLYAGTLGASDLGADWSLYQASLPGGYRYVIPVFELLNYNLERGDSVVLVDNVRIIPEPGVAVLLGVGASLLVGLRGRRRIV